MPPTQIITVATPGSSKPSTRYSLTADHVQQALQDNAQLENEEDEDEEEEIVLTLPNKVMPPGGPTSFVEDWHTSSSSSVDPNADTDNPDPDQTEELRPGGKNRTSGEMVRAYRALVKLKKGRGQP